MQAIILAGGKGTRLKPFTTNIPKPLIPIDDMPILEIILRQLKHHGVRDIVITVSHLSELIMAFFGDGKKLGLSITYLLEDSPLGTAGAIRGVKKISDDFIVMNGDLLTTIDYKKMFEVHKKNKNDVTISTYKKEIKIDLGILKIEQEKLIDYIEKPTYSFDVSMGIYVFNKMVLDYISNDEKIDMPSLMLRLKSKGRKIMCYSGDYYWLDIGRAEDYEEANKIFVERRSEFVF